MSRKIIWGIVVAVILIAGGAFFFLSKGNCCKVVEPDIKQVPDASTPNAALLQAGNDALVALKDKNYQKLEGLVSSYGLSLSFYPNFDPATKNIIPKNEVSEVTNDTKLYLWGYTDGKGDPINLTRAEALAQSDTIDYLHAPQVAIDKTLGSGNSMNSIIKDAGDRKVIAYHFDGFDPKYEGMDWTTMYLVFDMENGAFKLRGIAKDNWTI